MKYYLSIDIGASSGRHIISWIENGKINIKELYRFDNGMVKKNGHLCWDIGKLFCEILKGMTICGQKGYIPASMGIDTWGVDYVLLNEKNEILGDSYAYRDSRTEGMDEEVYKVISSENLYKLTGVQKQLFNTIYQLKSVVVNSPEIMAEADSMLMLPDYFAFLLTGIKGSEYTNATTSQLVSPYNNKWDMGLIDALGFKKEIFKDLCEPGTTIGGLKKDIIDFVGYNTKVVRVASHDTASAVVAVPSPDKETVYISSGTWSLMGVELEKANVSEAGMRANMTNEGGYEYRFRFLRNIMGLWMIQSLKKECAPDMSYGELCAMAERNSMFDVIVDVNDPSFFSPNSMKFAIDDYCRTHGLEKPVKLGEYAALVYKSLAFAYNKALVEIEELTGKHYERINVVGGGSKAGYLNKLTAEATGREVVSGPEEATAIGNAIVQMLADGTFDRLYEARKCVRESFDIKCYQPKPL
ncbi:MAG: rhamnulokinase [Eubacterium sp.]|nr:rhamnulokinase [Eubacterium sp.]